MNILLVEDNIRVAKGIKCYLENNNYNVDYVTSISSLKEYLLNNKNIHLIILDITLPDGDGYLFYKENKIDIPVIFLTAKDDEDIVSDALNSGADDYITKPFSSKELLARINKILKKNNIIKVSDISFDLNKMIVYKGSEEINLTKLELKLLQILFLNINKVVTRDFILEKVWEETGNDVDDHTITVYFGRIREKLGSDIIKTVKGIGYRIDGK